MGRKLFDQPIAPMIMNNDNYDIIDCGISFQLFEWIQWLRLTGQLEPRQCRTNTTCSSTAVLQELGHTGGENSARTKTRAVHVRDSDVKSIAQTLHIEEHDIDRAAKVQDKVVLMRNNKLTEWRTADCDLGKSTSAHVVAWTNDKTFTKHKEVTDLEEVMFGKIHRILVVKIRKSKWYLAKVNVHRVIQYRYGGIWLVDGDSELSKIIPIEQMSEPLISVPEGSNLAILNSKVKLQSVEARTMIDHLNIT